jgi:hypothetical protein
MLLLPYGSWLPKVDAAAARRRLLLPAAEAATASAEGSSVYSFCI